MSILLGFISIYSFISIHESFVSDNSAFHEVKQRIEGGFRLYNQFAVFTYSQLHNIFPDGTLGSISNWDGYLHLDLDQADLPFKTSSEFKLNEDYYNLVLASKLPRPGKFVDQSIAFCKAFCKLFCMRSKNRIWVEDCRHLTPVLSSKVQRNSILSHLRS